MDAVDVKDRESLEAWLTGRPRGDSIWIAHRAAMRVLPAWAWRMPSYAAQGLALSEPPILRALLTSGVGCGYATPEVKDASAAAARANIITATPSLASAFYSASASGALTAITPAVASASAAAVASGAASAILWEQIKQDCLALQRNAALQEVPLWLGVPNPFLSEWGPVINKWLADPDYAFWLRWYEAALAGTPPNWPLLRDIALIPDADWEKGIGHIAGVIAGIELNFAVARSGNGERLEINPETGLIRLVGDSDLPTDISAYARRKMVKALNIIGDASDNQYRPMEPAMKVIRDALEDATNLPVELFDACASSSRIIATLVRNEAVPTAEQDALINEYITLIREAGADILGNDTKTQDVLTRRNSILGNNALVENAKAIQFVVSQLVEVSEGTLVRVMPRDADLATQPSNDSVESKDSAFRLVGRLLRYRAVQLAKGAKGAVDAIVGAEKAWLVLTRLVATPQFQQVWAAILRWIGFG